MGLLKLLIMTAAIADYGKCILTLIATSSYRQPDQLNEVNNMHVQGTVSVASVSLPSTES